MNRDVLAQEQSAMTMRAAFEQRKLRFNQQKVPEQVGDEILATHLHTINSSVPRRTTVEEMVVNAVQTLLKKEIAMQIKAEPT